ncbi:MAG TPA: TetR family transcriptional regulator, partial [Allosphingosinicella sp.]
MTDDLNSVKTDQRGYHHGALRPALLKAAESVLSDRGVDGFSLRETARRAGVSPAAPAHHFGDTKGLLTALATEAFRQFGDALEAADVGNDRTARIRSQGRAYVRFALA